MVLPLDLGLVAADAEDDGAVFLVGQNGGHGTLKMNFAVGGILEENRSGGATLEIDAGILFEEFLAGDEGAFLAVAGAAFDPKVLFIQVQSLDGVMMAGNLTFREHLVLQFDQALGVGHALLSENDNVTVTAGNVHCFWVPFRALQGLPRNP